MIQIQNVSKSYNGKDKAVNSISLDIRDGEILGFLGPNGAGKTTTLKMMTGILEADEGEILINGISIRSNPLEAKRQFGFVSDDPNIFLRLKGREYLAFMADIYGVDAKDRAMRIETLAREFGMEQALADRIQNYSHGMRQKVILMGALVHEPPVWILDEPMTGLDPQSAFLLKQKMRHHADSGKTVVFSTHVLEVAEKVCDRVAIIDKGRLLFCGPIDELRQQREGGADSSLESIFLRLISEDEQVAAAAGALDGEGR